MCLLRTPLLNRDMAEDILDGWHNLSIDMPRNERHCRFRCKRTDCYRDDYLLELIAADEADMKYKCRLEIATVC